MPVLKESFGDPRVSKYPRKWVQVPDFNRVMSHFLEDFGGSRMSIEASPRDRSWHIRSDWPQTAAIGIDVACVAWRTTLVVNDDNMMV